MSVTINGDTGVSKVQDGVIVQADLASGVAGNGPAFRAYSTTNQTGISSNTSTKVTLGTENFDTNSNFDSSRFTPTVAGYYQFNFFASLTGTNLQYPSVNLYKNGSFYSNGNSNSAQVSEAYCTGSDIVYLNGSTDYVEMYVFGIVTSGTITVYSGSTSTRLSGSLVRAA